MNQRSIVAFGFDSGVEVQDLVYEAWDLAEPADPSADGAPGAAEGTPVLDSTTLSIEEMSATIHARTELTRRICGRSSGLLQRAEPCAVSVWCLAPPRTEAAGDASAPGLEGARHLVEHRAG